MIKKQKSKLKKFLDILGPGIVTGASDDDPSGIVTYTQAGAQFGLLTLWIAFITFPLMAAVESMCGRVGLVTKTGLAKILRQHYPKPLLYLIILCMLPAIVLNIGANIAGMGAVANLLFPKIPVYIFSILFTCILMVSIIQLSYKKIVTVLKYLCLTLFLYIIIPFLHKQDWLLILKHTLIPTLKFNKEYISIMVAILGTTISPYLFFWETTMEAEENNNNVIINKKRIKKTNMAIDLGMLFSNLIMYFIILTAGTVLFNHGINNIETVEQAAKALEPIAGKFSALLFATGVITTGFLAIPVLCGVFSYVLSESFHWRGNLNKKFTQAKKFYSAIIIALILGLIINYIGISPVQALIYTAILYGILAPVLIVVVMHIANNKKIMGKHCNSALSNILNLITVLLLIIPAFLLLYLHWR